MDVLKETVFAVPSVSHSCKKISKHNTSWSPHIFMYIFCIFHNQKWQPGLDQLLLDTWIHRKPCTK